MKGKRYIRKSWADFGRSAKENEMTCEQVKKLERENVKAYR
jgi:hypothetical protein